MPIRISIVEDNPTLRETLVRMFGQAPGIQCVSHHATGEEAVSKIPAANPDVALVDIHLPGMDGIECVSKLKTQMPDLQILMLTRYEQNDLVFNSIRAGASGYLLKNTPRAELIQAIESVHAGGAPMTMQVARKVIEHFRQIQQPSAEVEKLTPREQEVLALLAKGYLYKEIGDELGISINTLRNRLRAIYEKLHVHSRTEATVKFLGRD
jgi:DNA-binding NarL/FixJ family response regulator